MSYHFRNLIFEGGGVKGIAYVGAIEELSRLGILPQITRVGGTSAGAINAVLAALNCSPEEIRQILWELNFNSFLDDSWGMMRDSKRLLKSYGWYKGDFFRDWIGKIIRDKTGSADTTFEEIEALKLKEKQHFRSLFVIGTNLSTLNYS